MASAKAGPADGSGGAGEDGNANCGRLWRTVLIGEQEHRIDMQIIKPYLRVITHGGQCQPVEDSLTSVQQISQKHLELSSLNSLSSGYYGEGLNAIIVFSACYLPDSGCSDYHYVMENLFLYELS